MNFWLEKNMCALLKFKVRERERIKTKIYVKKIEILFFHALNFFNAYREEKTKQLFKL